jgi:hypothetical protein
MSNENVYFSEILLWDICSVVICSERHVAGGRKSMSKNIKGFGGAGV